ncbi:YgdI/YgdR family lipoprotein [Erwinia sp. P6884]|uniref:YgdI/YgdR family lipoprotein n=1 Tax=Erwinia sp. P6884 TaxID=3141450 RepID=UPI00318A5512
MKKTLMFLSVLTAGIVITGCADNHIVHMKDGTTKVVEGKPELDKATGMIFYTDESGNKQAVKQSDIAEMDSLDN